MDTLSYKTVSVSKEAAQAKKEWVVIDATDQVVGRLCSKVAKLLRGKYKPSFTPHVDCGDNVIIINAERRRGAHPAPCCEGHAPQRNPGSSYPRQPLCV